MALSFHVTEPAMQLVVDYLKANLPAALTAIRDDRNTEFGNYGVPTPPPKNSNYYITKKYIGYQPPCIIMNAENVDFKKSRGANHLNGTLRIGIAAIVEEKDLERLSRMAWRYQAAICQTLDEKSLTSSDGTFKIVLIVTGAEFSEEYTPSTSPEDTSAIWRKGVLVNIDCEFYEKLVD